MLAGHRNEEGHFTWPNGTKEDFSKYENWHKGEPNNFFGSEKCMAFWDKKKCLKWNDVSCDQEFSFICERPFCEDGESNSTCSEGKSFTVTTAKQTWKNAATICDKYNGTLAIIKNERTNSFILKQLEWIDDSSTKLNEIVTALFQKTEFFGVVLQWFAVHSLLTIIIGLCMDAGQSITSKFLRTKILQFLGRISLSLYLLHWPLIGAMNGQKKYGDSGEIFAACIRGKIYMPTWSPFILIIVSPIVAFITTKYFEEPISNILRGRK